MNLVVDATAAPAKADAAAAPASLETLRQELIATFDATEEPH